MKTVRSFFLTLALAVAVLFAAPRPAAAQEEDLGYIMAQLAQTTGCSPCYQSCVMTQAVIQFDYNIPALMGYLSAVSSAISNSIYWQIMEDDAWFFADWPLINNQQIPMRRSLPSLPATKQLYFPEYGTPIAQFALPAKKQLPLPR